MSRAEEIFLAAVDLAPAKRAAYLDEACADAALRAEVESLLAHDAGAENFLSRAVEEAAQSLEAAALPAKLGPWRIGARIGEGGMGAVYVAEREDPDFHQRAAIKLLKGPFPEAGMQARFLRERNLLAKLSHPNIAQLFDGGVSTEGQPYMVLELVDGQPIDAYVRERHLGTQAILELFLPIARAVEHAHQNLVVHRDLKPANILVNRDGVPKLLDFGIAQLLSPGQDATQTLALTLEYASPEQVRGEAPSPRMDVYSLGAVLYALTTGTPPLALRQMPLDQALESILHQDAPTAAQLPTDLARILAKALAKDPAQRYPSVESFRNDVERFLRREPVEARGASTLYRLMRFSQRRWLPLAATALVMAALAGGLYISQQALATAERERQAALAARGEALEAKEQAVRAQALAEARARELAQQVERADRNLLSARTNAAVVTAMLDQQFITGGSRQALATLEEWLKVQRAAVARDPNSPEALRLLGILEGRRCGFVAAENPASGLPDCEQSVAHLSPLLGTAVADEWLRISLSTSLATLGKLRGVGGQAAQGLSLLDRAATTLAPALAANPSDANLKANLATIGLYRGDILFAQKNTDAAAREYTNALMKLRAVRAQGTYRALDLQAATAGSRLARMLAEKSPRRARPLYVESLAVYRSLAIAPKSSVLDWNEYANALNESPFPDLRAPAEAVQYAEKAVAATKEKNPNALDTLAWAQFHAGQREAAVATQKKALALLPANPSPFRALLEKGLRTFAGEP